MGFISAGCLGDFIQAEGSSSPWQPESEEGLVLWFDASTLLAGSVSTWTNMGSLGDSMNATGSGVVVTASAQNGLSVIDTDGVDYLSWLGDPLNYASLTVIAAVADIDPNTLGAVHSVFDAQEQSGSYNGPVFETYNDYSAMLGQRQAAPRGNGYPVTGYKNNDPGSLLLDLNEFAAVAATYENMDLLSTSGLPFTMGAMANTGLRAIMRFGEVLVYDSAKSTEVLTQAYSYLAAKWGT